MHHPEQPALPSVVDDGIRVRAANVMDVARLTDLVVDVRLGRIELRERRHRHRVGVVRKLLAFSRGEAETGAAHQMLDGSCRFRHDD